MSADGASARALGPITLTDATANQSVEGFIPEKVYEVSPGSWGAS